MKYTLILFLILFASVETHAVSVSNFNFYKLEGDLKLKKVPVKYSNLTSQDKLAIKQFMEYFADHIKTCEGEAGVGISLNSNSIIEVLEPKYSMYILPYKINSADKLNHVTWKGTLHAKITGKAAREWVHSKPGEWKMVNQMGELSVNYPGRLRNNILESNPDSGSFVDGSLTDLSYIPAIKCS